MTERLAVEFPRDRVSLDAGEPYVIGDRAALSGHVLWWLAGLWLTGVTPRSRR